MMYDRKTYREWYMDRGLPSGSTFYPEPGVNVYANVAPVDITPCVYLSFSYRTALLSTLTLRGYTRPAGVGEVLWTMIVPAATRVDTYGLPIPLNEGGRYTLQLPMIRFEVVDGAAADHAYTRFYARAWWGG